MNFWVFVFIYVLVAIIAAIIGEVFNIRRKKAISKLISKREDAFRKIYNIPNDVKIVSNFFERTGGVLSRTIIEPTGHEIYVTRRLIEWGAFRPEYIFLDNYFRTKSGKIVQIDIIAVGKRGIFVFESKDYGGWIFGDGKQKKWTQMLYHEKHRFYNPILQNEGHIKAIKEIVGDRKVFSVILFGKKATLKKISQIPKNTFVIEDTDLQSFIDKMILSEKIVMTDEQMRDICRIIDHARINADATVRAKHIDEIKKIAME